MSEDSPLHPRIPNERGDAAAPLASFTVIICTRNRPEELNRCLEATMRSAYPRFDVLVVDNAPSDNRAKEVAARWRARYLLEPKPGLSRARNSGARSSNSELIAFLDDDAVPEPEWLSALADEFQDPQVMAASGRTVPLSLDTEAEKLAARLGGYDSPGMTRLVVDRATPDWFERANFGGLGNGMNMAFRRQAFDLWPGFDERLGRGRLIDGCEEFYAFFSLIDRGYRVAFTPNAVVRHPYPRTLEELQARHRKALAASGAYVTLLLAEQPRYRTATLRYVLRRLVRGSRPWQPESPASAARVFPPWQTLLARLRGPFLYLRS